MRQASATADWFFNENPYRIFVTYDDLIGPGKFLRSLASIQGEDYRALFPIRRDSDWGKWSLILPGGRKIDFGNQTKPFPDGVRKQRWADGRRFETTYRNGRPNGPFRAFLPDGTRSGVKPPTSRAASSARLGSSPAMAGNSTNSPTESPDRPPSFRVPCQVLTPVRRRVEKNTPTEIFAAPARISPRRSRPTRRTRRYIAPALTLAWPFAIKTAPSSTI